MARRKSFVPASFLHDPTDTKSKDHPLTPFIGSTRLYEKSIGTFYGCAFNPFVSKDENPIAAAVGNDCIKIFSFPPYQPEILKLASIQLDNKDSLYTVTWCYDDEEDSQNPHKIVTGGESGVIYVIDAATSSLDLQLVGHMDGVNDIRTSPKNPALIATASKDVTIRIFHIRAQTCLLILGGHQAHLDSVISVDWSHDASKLFSCGHDHRVVGWDLTQKPVESHLRECMSRVKHIAKLRSVRAYKNEMQRELEKLYNIDGHSLIFCRPSHVITNVHYGTVDCVRTIQLNNQNYILSRSCGGDNHISLWRLGKMNRSETVVEEGFRTDHFLIAKKKLTDAEIWFGKFEMEPNKKRWLSTIGDSGTVHFYDMRNQLNDEPFMTIKANPKGVMTRQVAFSPNGQIVFAVGDGGFACRIDRVPASGPSVPKDIWKPIK
ncbi:Protein CBG08298 [Caenorhabditis briggsae]|uniref:Protein CBG08298 n=1 Tax=Caenorhabditis briggsae TaxID=6238 RepID=A8X688_CAEBR|nr:Protein CBG08298 [Caenorhabditis briggsae]CAP28149.1 Protein CBG08298 [Caenorhabditis briggsae]